MLPSPTQKEPKRVLITAKVLPQTKQNIDEMRGEISIGKLLDSTVPHPPGWGDDELTRFFQIATEYGYATYVREKYFWPRLQQMDAVYYRISQNMDNASEWFYTLFFLRAHSIWRAAIRLAVSGQNPEAHILLRSFVENALYAFFIFNDKTHWENEKSRFSVWMKREESEKTLKDCREIFQCGKVISELKEKDTQLGVITKQIYDQSISDGAHPNVHGILRNVKFLSDEKERRIETQYMNCETDSFKFVLKRACQSGLCVLLMFKIIFRERFDILGISAEIERLKQGL